MNLLSFSVTSILHVIIVEKQLLKHDILTHCLTFNFRHMSQYIPVGVERSNGTPTGTSRLTKIMWRCQGKKGNLYEKFSNLLKSVITLEKTQAYQYSCPVFDTWSGSSSGDTVQPCVSGAESISQNKTTDGEDVQENNRPASYEDQDTTLTEEPRACSSDSPPALHEKARTCVPAQRICEGEGRDDWP